MVHRLTKSAWIKHGLSTLASGGIAEVKVGSMAAALGVSRGSFYWHFADIEAFRTALLDSWQDRTTGSGIRDFAGRPGPDRLRHLMRRAFDGDRALDRAVRYWATQNEAVARLVARNDERRIAHIAELLEAGGVSPRRAEARAIFVYWAYLGRPLVMGGAHGSLTELAIDELTDLFES